MYKFYTSRTHIPFLNPPATHLQSNYERSGKHTSTYTVPAAKTRTRNTYLLNRVATSWNSLPSFAVEATSLNSFKDALEVLFKDKKIRINHDAYM